MAYLHIFLQAFYRRAALSGHRVCIYAFVTSVFATHSSFTIIQQFLTYFLTLLCVRATAFLTRRSYAYMQHLMLPQWKTHCSAIMVSL